MDKLELPKRMARVYVEHRGTFEDRAVEDRPYRVERGVFNELKGVVEDVEIPLTDLEILMAGGLATFFTNDGDRTGNWPWTGEDKRKAAPKKKAKKKVSKK